MLVQDKTAHLIQVILLECLTKSAKIFTMVPMTYVREKSDDELRMQALKDDVDEPLIFVCAHLPLLVRQA